jgi:hypothetical protein
VSALAWQRQTPKQARWLGQHIFFAEGQLGELGPALPTFSRQALTHGPALNEYLDLIVRDAVPDDPRAVPVATVSKRYALIGHREALAWMDEAFAQAGWDPATLPVLVWMSDYGERLRVEINLPEAHVDPGDGFPLSVRIFLWNSVDRSHAFEIAFCWRRLICRNGLSIQTEDRFRKVHHIDWMSRASPVEFLRNRLPASRAGLSEMTRWLETKRSPGNLVRWADTRVARRWGVVRAARLAHILQTGHDCAVGRPLKDQRASQIPVVAGQAVPGAQAPVSNLYHAYQALLWIAGQEPAIDRQDELRDQAAGLIEPLLLEATT